MHTMTARCTYWRHAILIGLAVIFGLVLAGTEAHAARFGFGPHKHDGKICTLSIQVHNDDGHVLLPTGTDDAQPFDRFEISFSYTAFIVPICEQIVSIERQARAPPPA